MLALFTVIGGLGGFVYSSRQTPIYQSTALALVNQAPGYRATDYTSIVTSERLATTYVQVMTTRPVLEGVIERLGLQGVLSPGILKGAISASLVEETQLIRVSVTDTDPQRAADIANAVIFEFSEQNEAEQAERYAASKVSMQAELERLDEQIETTQVQLAALEEDSPERPALESSLSQYRSSYTSILQLFEQIRLTEAQSMASVVQKEPAIPASRPVQPRTMQNTALAAAVGLMIAAGLAFLIEYLDTSLKTPEDVNLYLGLPVIGLVGEMERLKDKSSYVYVADNPRSPIAEAFRTLRTNLEFSAVDKPIRTLLISSAGPSEGKTTVAVNLAAVIAQGDRQVTLIDADLRRPNVHRYLKIPNRIGLTELFRSQYADQVALDQVMVKWGEPPFLAVPSGSIPPNPAELLGSERMRQLLEEFQKTSDMVIIDGPPFILADPVVLSSRVDGVLLVIKPGETKIEAAQAMLEQLNRAGARVLGVVLNPITRSKASYYSGRYRYYSEYYYSRSYGHEPKNGRGRRSNGASLEDEEPEMVSLLGRTKKS